MHSFVCAKKCWRFGCKGKTEIKTENMLPCGFSKPCVSCSGWVISDNPNQNQTPLTWGISSRQLLVRAPRTVHLASERGMQRCIIHLCLA